MLPPTLGVGHMKPDRMLVVGDDVVDLDPEVAAGQLHGPAEVAEHRIHAPMVTGQLVTSRCVPDDVVFVPELPHTATGKLLKSKLREQFRDYQIKSA